MQRGATIRRHIARGMAAVVLAATVTVVGAVPAGATTNPPPFLRTWGSLGSGTTQFDAPSAVAVGPGGEVFTLDSVRNRVQVFTPGGTFVRQFGGTGAGRGKFTNPEGIAVDSLGNVYVTDDGDRIQKFDSTGAWVMRIGLTGTSLGRLSDPAGIAVDPDDNLYVVDRGNNRIQKFDSETGRFLNAFGVAGSQNGQFNAPRAVAVDGDDHVIVADTGNHRVQVFSLFGAWVRTFGGPGAGDGQFNAPTGVAADSESNLYVTDSGNDRVQEWTNTGTYLTSFGTTGSGKGKFHGPSGVAVNDVDDVVVTDAGNHRVQVFGQVPQPDLAVRFGTSGGFSGVDVFNTSGRNQSVSGSALRSTSATYDVTVENAGVFADRIRLRGAASTSSFAVRYSVSGANVTAAVVGGTYKTPSLAPGQSLTVRVRVTVSAGAAGDAVLGGSLLATSKLDSTRRDLVRFTTSVR